MPANTNPEVSMTTSNATPLNSAVSHLALTIGDDVYRYAMADQDAAMKRYCEAFQGGTPSSLVAVEGPIPEAPPEIQPLHELSAEERARIESEWLSDAGFATRELWFSPGNPLNGRGDGQADTAQERFIERHTRMRQAFERMPEFNSSALKVIGRVKSEDRQDHKVLSTEVHMLDSGALIVAGEPVYLNPRAWTDLVRRMGFANGRAYLASIPADRRAAEVNHHLQGAEVELLIRVRRRVGGLEAYAIRSHLYGVYDVDRVLSDVLSTQALDGSRTDLAYRDGGIDGVALWMPDEIGLSVGHVFKAGVHVRTSDTGNGAIEIRGSLWRDRCSNLIMIDNPAITTLRVRHLGEMEDLSDRIVEGVEAAKSTIAPFVEAWEQAASVQIDQAPEVTYTEWLARRRLELKGVSKENAISALLSAYHVESEDVPTLQGLVNGVTRAAHEADWGEDLRRSLELQASRLVLLPR